MKIKNLSKNFVSLFKKLGLYDESEILLKKEEELTGYINKIFEQQEKERIVRWLVNSIRESLDLDTVLEKTVEKVSKLLNVDRCLIALFDEDTREFNFRNEYRINDEIISVLDNIDYTKRRLLDPWHELVVENFDTVAVDDCEKEKLSPKGLEMLKNYNIKSLVISPIVHKDEILGIISAHQVKNKRKWENEHVEILKDIGSQIAVAIRQAILYAKVQEATRLKSEFLSGMSHELRTPLNAIIGFSEMLLSDDYGALSEKQRKFINNISLSGEHLLRLVNDILDLSKIESGNMEINYETFSVNQVIQETVSVLNSLVEKKSINIETKVDVDLLLNADVLRFKQVMYNLLSNALKFTEENGQVKVIACQEKDGLRVEVHDTGIGIAAKDRDKIFKNFRQLDSSITRKQEGTGLGLTLSKKLIELHKGTIDFESEEGKGSMFWFIIPGVFSQKPV